METEVNDRGADLETVLRGEYLDRTAARTRTNSTTARLHNHNPPHDQYHEAILKLMRVLIRGRSGPEVDDGGIDLHIVLREIRADRSQVRIVEGNHSCQS